MKKQHVQLTQTDREYLETLISKGQQSARVYRRALGLLELDRGKTYTAVSQTLQVAIPTLSNWAAQYAEKGLKVLKDKERPGRPIEIDGEQRAKVTALACSEPARVGTAPHTVPAIGIQTPHLNPLQFPSQNIPMVRPGLRRFLLALLSPPLVEPFLNLDGRVPQLQQHRRIFE
jgi:hypothetical protein